MEAQAQYKPGEAGGQNLELMVAPLGGSPITMAGIKYRQFSSPTEALRAAVFLGFDNKSTITQDEGNGNLELKDKVSTFTIGLQPGVEKHMAGTERLSPYFGGYLDLNFTTKTETKETQLMLNNGSNALGSDKTTSGSMGIGVNAVAGFDYYIAKSLYLGTELGFGLATTLPFKNKGESVTLNSDGTGTITVSGDGKANTTSKFQVGPNVVGQLRLGWFF